MTENTNILVVDDDVAMRFMVSEALDQAGYQVHEAGNGIEALDALHRLNYDIILLDVMMPVLDGIETYRQLREKPSLKDKPVIFMTAKVQPHEVQGYKDLGAIDVIPKPFDPMTLSEEIQTIWQQHISKEPV